MAVNSESTVCLWLDSEVNSSEENQRTQQRLRQIYNDLRTFENIDHCEQYIRKTTNKKIILIVSGGLGREIVPRLHDLPLLSACYIFCGDKKANEGWSSKYSKINGVLTQPAALINQITKDQTNGTETEENASISVLSSNTENLQSRNAMFMWFQLFIEVILHMHHKLSDRKELIGICRTFYINNNKQMKIIDDFENAYVPEEAIWWYTRDSCFYRTMNKALREQDFDVLFSFRFLITDIAKQIQQKYEDFIRTSGNRSIIRVYRGQAISIKELELMQNNIGEFLSMNSFLSTSRNRSTAIDFARIARKKENMRSIVFYIKIDPKLRTKAFADVNGLSFYKDEDEVLIMLGALFHIEKIYEDKENQLWVAEVSLAGEDDFHLKETFSHMKEKIGGDTNLDSLGKLLLRMDEDEKARKCYKRMLDESQLIVSNARLGLGWSCLRCNAYDESLEHFEESLKIRKHIHGENHASVGEIYGFFGEAYRRKNDYEKAIEYLKKAITIQEKTLPNDSLDLAAIYDTIAVTYTTISKYDLASKYFEKVLEIRQAKLPSNHPQIAAIKSDIGWLYECKEDYTQALNHYQQALNISKMTLPPTHQLVVGAEKNVRRLSYNTTS